MLTDLKETHSSNQENIRKQLSGLEDVIEEMMSEQSDLTSQVKKQKIYDSMTLNSANDEIIKTHQIKMRLLEHRYDLLEKRLLEVIRNTPSLKEGGLDLGEESWETRKDQTLNPIGIQAQ